MSLALFMSFAPFMIAYIGIAYVWGISYGCEWLEMDVHQGKISNRGAWILRLCALTVWPAIAVIWLLYGLFFVAIRVPAAAVHVACSFRDAWIYVKLVYVKPVYKIVDPVDLPKATAREVSRP